MEPIRAIQILETAKSEADANEILHSLADQWGWIGGRVLPPRDINSNWRVQGFVEDNPHAGNPWLPDGCRRVILPHSFMRFLNARGE
jgi:hypothetical protein